MFAGKVLPCSFLGLFSSESVERADQFWKDLLSHSTVFSYGIPVSHLSYAGEAKFDGMVGNKEISIVVSNDANGLWEEINSHEQSEDVQHPPSLLADSESFNEMSRLNNELVNLQRKMVKQNLLVETLTRNLETNDQKFQLLSRAINDAIWDWNILEDSIQLNQRFSAIYGYSLNEFPKTLEAWAVNIHPDEREDATKALKSTIENGGLNWKFLYRYKCFNGTYKYTFDRGFIVYFGNQPIRMISVMQDIDERMASLQEIEKLSLVASKTDNLVIITDHQEKIEWVNEGFTKVTGYSLNEVIGKTPKFMQGPETDRTALDIIHQHIQAKEPVSQEILNYTKDGRKFWVKVNINPVFDEENKLLKFVAVETDVTPHKEYESKITAIATDLTNLIATVNAPVFGIDCNGYINEWNNLAAHLTGFSKNEILGSKFVDTIVDSEFHANIVERLSSVFSGTPLSNLELPIVSKNGKRIIVLINATPRKNAQNMVSSVFLVGQDITALTEYRQSLEEKVRERTEDLENALRKERELVSVKTRFASMVSHEFRTPLSTIKLSANYLKKYRSRLQSDEIDMKLDTIHEQVIHMTHMLEDVLTIGKSDAGRIELNRKPLNIKDFLQNIANEVENQFKNSHKIVCALSIERFDVYSDPDLLRNIFVNLLSNAIKFSPGKTEVDLRGHDAHSNIRFEIIDNGIGIAPADAERIFNPFDRGTNTTSIPGTGLGLSIVKKAVDLMRGSITFTSTTGGTKFVIVFPKAEFYA
jgi:PAS domain S-box-containing protein